jgi:hypothetical protein
MLKDHVNTSNPINQKSLTQNRGLIKEITWPKTLSHGPFWTQTMGVKIYLGHRCFMKLFCHPGSPTKCLNTVNETECQYHRLSPALTVQPTLLTGHSQGPTWQKKTNMAEHSCWLFKIVSLNSATWCQIILSSYLFLLYRDIFLREMFSQHTTHCIILPVQWIFVTTSYYSPTTRKESPVYK